MSGSGIFVSDSFFVYFITASHVMAQQIDTLTRLTTDFWYLTTYPDNSINDTPAISTFNALKAISDSYLEFHPTQDIAVAIVGRIAPDSSANGGWVINYPFFSTNRKTVLQDWSYYQMRSYNTANIGADVFVFGYPSSIGMKEIPQFDYDRPLLRKGTIAGRYDTRKSIIIDCPVYHGNSGGPVFIIEEQGFDKMVYLVGIATEYIPVVEEYKSSSGLFPLNLVSNSGYGVVVSMDYAAELIRNLRNRHQRESFVK